MDGVTAFWFTAEGFSVYAITEGDNPKTDGAKTYGFYESYAVSAKSESTATVADAYKKLATASATARTW